MNGLAKRMNKTIVERVRSMQSLEKLPKPYWVEAKMMVMYLINKSSVPIVDDVPQSSWKGRDVSYKNLRVFGCLAYIHIGKD